MTFPSPLSALPWHPGQNPAGQTPASFCSSGPDLVEIWENVPSGPGGPLVFQQCGWARPRPSLHAPVPRHSGTLASASPLMGRPLRPERTGRLQGHTGAGRGEAGGVLRQVSVACGYPPSDWLLGKSVLPMPP